MLDDHVKALKDFDTAIKMNPGDSSWSVEKEKDEQKTFRDCISLLSNLELVSDLQKNEMVGL